MRCNGRSSAVAAHAPSSSAAQSCSNAPKGTTIGPPSASQGHSTTAATSQVASANTPANVPLRGSPALETNSKSASWSVVSRTTSSAGEDDENAADADGDAASAEIVARLLERPGRSGDLRGLHDLREYELPRRRTTGERLCEGKEEREPARSLRDRDDRARRLGRRRHRKCGVLAKDRALELTQLLSELEPQLFVEHTPAFAEDGESVGLPSGSVQGEHELCAWALVQRPLGDERLELGDELRSPPEREVGLDPLLQRQAAQLLEAGRLRLHELLVREVSQRLSSPERQSRAKCRRALRGLLSRGSFQEPLELVEVELARPHAQEVPGAVCLQRVSRCSECLAKVGDVDLDRLCGGPGNTARPQVVREPIRRDDLVRVEEQDREHGALARCAQVETAITVESLEWAKDPELHGATVLRFAEASLPRVRSLPAARSDPLREDRRGRS